MPPKRGSSRRAGSIARNTGPTESLNEISSVAIPGRRGANNESRRTTRSQSRMSSISPVRAPTMRRDTLDEKQALESPHQASANVSRSHSPERLNNQGDTSSATPSTPIQHTISTTSTPAAPTLNPSIVVDEDSPLVHQDDRGPASFAYPSLPPSRSQANRESSIISSPRYTDSLDNDSTISWTIERDLHGDEVQRTRPNRYRQEPYGRNISAPPRRLSGLTFPDDTTHEHSQAAFPVFSSARARTVISTTAAQDYSNEDSAVDYTEATPIDDSSSFASRSGHSDTFMVNLNRIKLKWPIITALLVAFAAFGAYFLGDHLAAVTRSLSSSLSFGWSPYSRLNASDSQVVIRLANEVEKLGSQLSSMSSDMSHLKAERIPEVEQVTVVRPAEPEVTHRINFLSKGMGTTVDLSLTSPSIGQRRTLIRRLYENISGHHEPHPNPPDAALELWDGVGDCWCSAPGKSGQAQILILLGQRAVPEEVVVEHIPTGASPEPDVAPREMELWAQFKLHDPSTTTNAMSSDQTPILPSPPFWLDRIFSLSGASSTHSSSSSSPTSASDLSPSSLRDAIMETLYRVYPKKPETAYSNDALLGPSFFRLGKWQYDRDGGSIQHFTLDAIIDLPTLRVDKVVFRVKSNWGGPHTCLYRLKLYGHP